MRDVTDEDVREALRDLGATATAFGSGERWAVGRAAVAFCWVTGSWLIWDNPWDNTTEATEGPADANVLAAVRRLRDRFGKPVQTHERVIAHLRSLSAEGLLELLREARVCVGWEDYDDEGVQTDDEIELSQLHTMCSRTVAFCRPDFCTPGWWWRLSTPDGSPGPHGLVRDLPTARGAAEDAAIAAGYRVPWRQT